MPVQLRVITDEDWNILKKLVEQNRNQLQSPITRPTANSQFMDGDDSMAPEVYIALPPADGIPGLDSITVGSGTDNPPAEGDRPGHAECNIYRIVDGELKLVSGLTRTVYNLSESTIEQDWILIERDKFGTWVPVVGSRGGSSEGTIIRFTIVSAGDCGGWLVSIDARPCGVGTLPGEHDGYLIAYAVLTCLEPAVGMTGYAQYMTGESIYCEGTGTGSGDPESSSCRWEITSLCC